MASGLGLLVLEYKKTDSCIKNYYVSSKYENVQ